MFPTSPFFSRRDVDGNPIFVDGDGNETIVPIEGTPNWVPVYLDKGELTFDTSGRLISPKEGAAYTPSILRTVPIPSF